MKTLARISLVLALALIIAAPLAAQEEKKKRRRQRKNRGPAVVNRFLKQVEKAEPTEEQQEKIKKLVAEHKPKIAKAAEKAGGILTRELRQKQNAARKAAQAEGKKGKQLQQAIAAALDLPQEQKEALAAARKQQQQAMNALRRGVAGVLSAEQLEKAGIKVGRRGKKAGQNAGKKNTNKKKKKGDDA